MSANQDTYGNPAWGRPAAGAAWGQASGGQTSGGQTDRAPFMGGVRTFLDGLPRPVAIGLMVLAFAFWWPIGLATLCYMIGSGRLGAHWQRRRAGGGPGAGSGAPAWASWNAWTGGAGTHPSSGNHAFDEYKHETLKRLEDEQQEFTAFLERLRFAKDKAEFDQFMAERRGRPPTTSADGEQTAA